MRVPLYGRILAGAAVGAGLGALAGALLAEEPLLVRAVEYGARPLGQVFLRLLSMLGIPFLFAAFALAVARRSAAGEPGSVVSSIAILLAFVLARAELLVPTVDRAAAPAAAAPQTWIDVLVRAIPRNAVQAAASGDLLAVIFFSGMIGLGLRWVESDAARSFEEVIEGLYDILLRLFEIVLRAAPLGVGCLLFAVAVERDDVLLRFASCALVVALALGLCHLGARQPAGRLELG